MTNQKVLLVKMSFRPGKSGVKSDEWEVPFKALMFDDSLGSGAFGKVVRATVNIAAVPVPSGNENSPARNLQPDTTVAVKLLHGKYGLRLIYKYFQNMIVFNCTSNYSFGKNQAEGYKKI